MRDKFQKENRKKSRGKIPARQISANIKRKGQMLKEEIQIPAIPEKNSVRNLSMWKRKWEK
jgi:hypothetical protein